MTTSTIKLPPLSVLLAPREHAFASSCQGVSTYTCCPTFQQQHNHHHHYAQQFHHRQQEHYNHYPYASSEGSIGTPSAPGSPASPTWWTTSASSSRSMHHADYAPQPSSAPFWKHTSGLEAFRTAALPHDDVPMQSRNSSMLTSEAYTSRVQMTTDAVAVVSSTGVRPKKSRYLREMDRRAIIRRLDMGEKQCALAREFSVSRSSICNLFKHRAEVLSRAAHQSPFSKHPKKCKKQPQPQPPRRRFA
ncbi:hypothetical protein PybrP1_010874 [[Pythium] brassicae (nom. inval.)]|nr:hypothetical protein PybrP1_010874 [[Pythium] brassicae (nom. inval.)]